MRYLLAIAALFFIVSGARLCPAQHLPPGDYVQSCRNIHVYGNQLDAECQRRNGSWQRTSLDFGQCMGRIINNDGRLTCAGGGYGHDQGGWEHRLPYGDYVQTCRNIRVYGNRLEAECQRRNGGWRRTALDYIDQCSSPIANDNGRLICGSGGYGSIAPWQGDIPAGTYTQTCRNIRVYGNRLQAECQKRDGSWRRTSLDNLSQCTSAPANDDGFLVCGGSGYNYNNRGWQGGIPAGTYTQTCRNLQVYGNRLEAECQRRDGGWRRTSLDNIDQCTSAPANDDGYLSCRRS